MCISNWLWRNQGIWTSQPLGISRFRSWCTAMTNDQWRISTSIPLQRMWLSLHRISTLLECLGPEKKIHLERSSPAHPAASPHQLFKTSKWRAKHSRRHLEAPILQPNWRMLSSAESKAAETTTRPRPYLPSSAKSRWSATLRTRTAPSTYSPRKCLEVAVSQGRRHRRQMALKARSRSTPVAARRVCLT